MPRKKTGGTSPLDKIKSSQTLGHTSGALVSDHLHSLAATVRSDFPKISEESLATLISEAEVAVSQLVWDRHTDRKQQREKLAALSESAGQLAEKLAAVLGDSALASPFAAMLVRIPNGAPPTDPKALELLPEAIREYVLHQQQSQPPPDFAAVISAQVDRRDRIRDHLIGDLLWIRTVLGPVIDLAEATEGMKTPEYRCAMRLARAWFKATGKKPTTTKNMVAVSGPQATGFQRFLAAAVPGPPIGPGIVENVKRDFGVTTTANRPNESPKGYAGT
ncbi:hypothetical protein ACO2JO_01115 [Leptospira interrogans]